MQGVIGMVALLVAVVTAVPTRTPTETPSNVPHTNTLSTQTPTASPSLVPHTASSHTISQSEVPHTRSTPTETPSLMPHTRSTPTETPSLMPHTNTLSTQTPTASPSLVPHTASSHTISPTVQVPPTLTPPLTHTPHILTATPEKTRTATMTPVYVFNAAESSAECAPTTVTAGFPVVCSVHLRTPDNTPWGGPEHQCYIGLTFCSGGGSAPSQLIQNATFRQGGEFDFAFYPAVSGVTTVNIGVAGEPITVTGNSITVNVASVAPHNSVSNCTVGGAGNFACAITHRDAFGNEVSTCVVDSVTGGDGNPFNPSTCTILT